MKSIVVFCGSKHGKDPIYAEIARQTGELIASKQIRLVYGGGSVGLMGVMANAAMEAGGKVLGVIPGFLQKIEGMDIEISETHLVETMYERKQVMALNADAVLVLPGAYGTLDELFEILTLDQLNQGSWPIGILNAKGYYDHLLAHVDLMHEEGFLSSSSKNLFFVKKDLNEIIDTLIQKMDDHTQPSPSDIKRF